MTAGRGVRPETRGGTSGQTRTRRRARRRAFSRFGHRPRQQAGIASQAALPRRLRNKPLTFTQEFLNPLTPRQSGPDLPRKMTLEATPVDNHHTAAPCILAMRQPGRNSHIVKVEGRHRWIPGHSCVSDRFAGLIGPQGAWLSVAAPNGWEFVQAASGRGGGGLPLCADEKPPNPSHHPAGLVARDVEQGDRPWTATAPSASDSRSIRTSW